MNELDEFVEKLEEYMDLLATSEDSEKILKLEHLTRDIGNRLGDKMGTTNLQKKLAEIPLTMCRADSAWEKVQ